MVLGPAGRRIPTAVAGVAAVIVIALFIALLVLERSNEGALSTITDLADGAASMIAAVTCAWAARKSTGGFSRGWALMATSATSWLAGNIVWTLSRIRSPEAVPFPSLADVGFLASLPLAMAGVLALWSISGGSTARWGALIDGLIVLVALIAISWIFGLDTILSQTQHTFATALGLAYPFGDTLVLTVLILSISRATRVQRGPMLLLLGGLGAMAIADAMFAYATALPSSTEGPLVDVGWVPGYLMVAVAALWSARSSQHAADKEPTLGWQLSLPSVAVWTAAATIVIRIARTGAVDGVLLVLTTTMAALLAMSQLIAHRDAMARLFKSRQSEALLSEMIAHARRGIAQIDRQYRNMAVNPGIEALLGEPAAKVIGTPISRYLPPETHQVVFEKLGSLMRGELDSFELEVPVVRADGRRLWVGATAYAVKDAEGHVDYALLYLEDLTSKHEADESERKSLHVLEDLNRVRMEFIRSISHDFKTGLVGIKGFSELIRDATRLDPAEAREYASEIYRSAEHLDALVTEMTELDTVEMTPISLSIEPVDMNGVVATEVARFDRGANPITTDLAPGLPAINADPAKLSVVVRTLLLNAKRYSSQGGAVHVSTAVSLGEVIVSVRDQGVGMRADFDNQLFGSGDLYANNPIRKVVGTGLGLGIARRIVEMHGGHIWLERLDTGSVAHFTVPVATSASMGVKTSPPPAPTAQGSRVTARLSSHIHAQ